jgi:hypothetical protein
MKKLLFYCVVLLGLGSCHQAVLFSELGSEEASLKVARKNSSIFLMTNLDTTYSGTMTKIPLKKFKKLSIMARTSRERPYDTLFLERLISSKYIKESHIDLTFYEGKLNELDTRLCELPNILKTSEKSFYSFK